MPPPPHCTPASSAITALLCMALLASPAACDGDTQPPPDPREALVGVWAMTSANGAPLPLEERPFASDTRTQITGGALRFSNVPRGSLFLFCRRRYPVHAEMPPYVQASWWEFGFGVEGETVTFNWITEGFVKPETGTLQGPDLTLWRTFEIDDRTYTFRKVSDDPTGRLQCEIPAT